MKKKYILVFFLLFMPIFFSSHAKYLASTNEISKIEESFNFKSLIKNLKNAKISRRINISGNQGWVDFKNDGNCTGQGTYSDPYVIEDLIIDGGGLGSCIKIESSSVYFLIRNCTIFNSNYGNGGIKLQSVKNGMIINNDASNNDGEGISLSESDNNTIIGNTANDTSSVGLHLQTSNNNTIMGNTVNNNWNGISLLSCLNNVVRENNIKNSTEYGIRAYFGDNNEILGNTVEYCGESGIRLTFNDNHTIHGNNLNENQRGISFQDCIGTMVSGNIIKNSIYEDILLVSSNKSIISGNIVNLIWEVNSYNNVLIWNVIDGITDPFLIDNYGEGDFTWTEAVNQLAWVYGSGTYHDPYVIEDLTFYGNQLGSCIEIRNSNVFFIIRNCTVFNAGNGGTDAGLWLDNVSNGILISNYVFNNSWVGIRIRMSTNNTVSDNIVNNNGIGIYLGDNNLVQAQSNNNTVLKNSLNNNVDGITLILSNNNTVVNNNITTDTQASSGVKLSLSHNNIISGNIISNMSSGIMLSNANYNSIVFNTLINNRIAIEQFQCEGNNIKGNIIQEPINLRQILFTTLTIVIVLLISLFSFTSFRIIKRTPGAKKRVLMNFIYFVFSLLYILSVFLPYHPSIPTARMFTFGGWTGMIFLILTIIALQASTIRNAAITAFYGNILIGFNLFVVFGSGIGYFLALGSWIALCVLNYIFFKNQEDKESSAGNMIPADSKSKSVLLLIKSLHIVIPIVIILSAFLIPSYGTYGLSVAESTVGPYIFLFFGGWLGFVSLLISFNNLPENIKNAIKTGLYGNIIIGANIIFILTDSPEWGDTRRFFGLGINICLLLWILLCVVNGLLFIFLRDAKLKDKKPEIPIPEISTLEEVIDITGQDEIEQFDTPEKKKSIIVFISYAMKDSQLFNIKEIAESITSYEEIERVLYCEEDTKDNFVKYMNKFVGECDVMILFCSPNAIKSDFVEDEWTAAHAMKKPIIPVFIKTEHIPPLLRARIGVEFDTFDARKNVDLLYNLILKKTHEE